MSEGGKTYWAIVRGQFRKNRAAVVGLWCVVALFAIAVCAPVLASSSPFLLQVGEGGTEYPWFRDLFDQNVFPSGVDLFFNLLLVMTPVVLPLAWLLARWRKRVLQVSVGLLLWLFLCMAAGPEWFESRFVRVVLFPEQVLRYSKPKRDYLKIREPELLPALVREKVAFLERVVGEKGQRVAEAERQLARRDLDASRRADFEVIHAAAQDDLDKTSRALRSWSERRAQAEQLAADPARRVRTWMPPVGYHHDDNDNDRITEAPTWSGWGKGHFLGTDPNGRDVLARILYGTRVSMTIGLLAAALYCTIGTILGSLMGFFGGWVDLLGMRIVEVMICFPHLPFILILVGVTGSKNIFMIMAAIGIISWPGVARLVRGQFLSERNLDYVLAARSLGIPDRRIVFRHVLPNAIHPVFVSATFGVASAILLESSLAFLGLGDPLVPSWGQLMLQGRTTSALWLILSPGAAIFVTVIVLNLVGEGLRDALDPKLRQ